MEIPYVIDNQSHRLADICSALLREFQSPSLDIATPYFTVRGFELLRKGLLRARKFINRQLGEQLAMKYTPTLRFVLDETAERAQRIEKVLRDIDGQQRQQSNSQEPDTEVR